MKINNYIIEFQKLGIGMVVHYGLYSISGKGEWAFELSDIDKSEYEKQINKFNPSENWAKELVCLAKRAGCKYITFSTRHHDGFSLYDTCGLSDYDCMHAKCKRDLVKEFVSACNEENILPVFYHTLLDWHEESYKKDFKKYLIYLRESVKLLCKNYGKIGGFWFDGMWDRTDDWEEDKLYSMIRSYLPEAIIINNTGLTDLGKRGNPEIDCVTFERGKVFDPNKDNKDKYLAGEMSQVFGDHWAYTVKDFNFKSLSSIIEDVCNCRKYGANFLINMGLKEDGGFRSIEKAMLETLGEWVNIYDEALRFVPKSLIKVENKNNDFIIQKDNVYYLFCFDIPMETNANITIGNQIDLTDIFYFNKRIEKIIWIDNGDKAEFTENKDRVSVKLNYYKYGYNYVVRIAKIITEK